MRGCGKSEEFSNAVPQYYLFCVIPLYIYLTMGEVIVKIKETVVFDITSQEGEKDFGIKR